MDKGRNMTQTRWKKRLLWAAAWAAGIVLAAVLAGAFLFRHELKTLTTLKKIPKIEVHISNVHTREEFRHTSVTVPVCNGQVVGLGLKGYLYAMEAVVDLAMKK